MAGVTTTAQHGPLTREDLDRMRDADPGRRYELIDGSVVVTPAPGRWHQSAVLEVAVLLRQHCPPELTVMIAPFDVVLTPDTSVQPDVLVARRADLSDRDLPGAPLLAVEVLSPSTRRIDLLLKRERYQRAGCPSCWVIDPLEPSLTVWELHDDRYAEPRVVTGEDQIRLTTPFAVHVRPADLVRP